MFELVYIQTKETGIGELFINKKRVNKLQKITIEAITDDYEYHPIKVTVKRIDNDGDEEILTYG